MRRRHPRPAVPARPGTGLPPRRHSSDGHPFEGLRPDSLWSVPSGCRRCRRGIAGVPVLGGATFYPGHLLLPSRTGLSDRDACTLCRLPTVKPLSIGTPALTLFRREWSSGCAPARLVAGRICPTNGPAPNPTNGGEVVLWQLPVRPGNLPGQCLVSVWSDFCQDCSNPSTRSMTDLSRDTIYR
jgi:hypothetical protein